MIGWAVLIVERCRLLRPRRHPVVDQLGADLRHGRLLSSPASGAGCDGSGSCWTGSHSSPSCSSTGGCAAMPLTLSGVRSSSRRCGSTPMWSGSVSTRPCSCSAGCTHPGYTSGTTWCGACYMSHFFVSFIVAGVLWKTNYAKFRRFVALFVGLTFIGYVTYVLYPAMPPWMASQYGHLPHSVRIIDQVWKHLHLGLGVSLFAGGKQLRQQRRGHALAPRRVPHAHLPLLLEGLERPQAHPAGGLSDLHGLLTRLHRRALRHRHLRGLDLRRGHGVYIGSKLLDRWEARRIRKKVDATFDEPTSMPPTTRKHHWSPDKRDP